MSDRAALVLSGVVLDDLRMVESEHLDALRGKRIRIARDAHGWTQAQLAELLKVSAGSVKNWERGIPPRSKLGALEDLLEVDLETGSVRPPRDDAPAILLDLPEEALEGLDAMGREEVAAAARLAALGKAREIRNR